MCGGEKIIAWWKEHGRDPREKLLIFSDGEDTNAMVDGRSLDSIISGAVDAGVPVYLIRTNYNKREGDPAVPDKLWREAVVKTGGKFFAASSLLVAVLAVVLAGKGIAGLQEAGWIHTSPVAFPPSRSPPPWTSRPQV